MTANSITLRPPKAPNLPLSPVDYSQQYHDQLLSLLRLYFNQLDNFDSGVVDAMAYPPQPGLPLQFYLTTAGDGTGTYNMNQNFSGAVTEIYYKPAAGVYYIFSILIAITDNTTFNYNDFGGIVGGVTNGVGMYYTPFGGTEVQLLSGINFKHNFEWLEITEHTLLTSFAGTPQTLAIAFEMSVDYGQSFLLNTGDKIAVKLHDDFSSLLGFTLGIRGVKVG